MFKKRISSLLTGALLVLSSSAFANTWVLDQYTLDYTETSSSVLLNAFSEGENTVGFTFSLKPTVNVINVGSGGIVSIPFALPSFTVTSNAAYFISGEITGKIGNLSFSEAPGAVTSATFSGTASIDGLSSGFLNAPLTKDPFVPGGGIGEFRSSSSTAGQGVFNEFKLTGGTLTLTADNSGGVFSSISSQSQSEFRISFTALPVPELESYAMLLAGLCLIGAITRRRRRAE